MLSWVLGEISIFLTLIKSIKSWMNPNGQTQPQRDLPIKIPNMRNEATASHGKKVAPDCIDQPLSISCAAVKASPTMFCLKPQVHKTGSKIGKELKLKIKALNKRNDMN